jgi:hypothetical protein
MKNLKQNKTMFQTVICPHREMLSDLILIPKNATHLKFIKPGLKLKTGYFKKNESSFLKAVESEYVETEDESFQVNICI